MNNPALTYHEYMVPAIFSRWAPGLLKHARPKSGERALDLACGTGVVSNLLAESVGENGTVVALDINPAMLDVARQQSPPSGAPIQWLERSAQDPPEGPFDLIVCQQGLQFFPDPVAAVSAMRRVLVDGGRAVVSVWQDLDTQPVFRALMEAEAAYLGVPLADVGVPFMFERRHALEPLFRDAGFSTVEVRREALLASFPEPDRYLELTLMAGAAVIPELAEMSETERGKLFDGVKELVAPVLDRHTQDGKVSFEMHNNTVIASV